MLKEKMADLPFAVLLAKANAIPAVASPPGNAFSVEPPNAVRSGAVPCGVPKLKLETSNVALPTVAGMAGGVNVLTVVAGNPAKSQAATKSAAARGVEAHKIRNVAQGRILFITTGVVDLRQV
jgi:hypothetical protein